VKEVEYEEIPIQFPKALADAIQQSEWFKKYYVDLEDFICEAARRRKEEWFYTAKRLAGMIPIEISEKTYAALEKRAEEKGITIDELMLEMAKEFAEALAKNPSVEELLHS